MFHREFAEEFGIQPAFMPVDMSSAAVTGDRVSLKNADRLIFVLLASIGTAGDDPVISCQQHDAATSGNSKALNFTRIRHKVGATAISAVENFTLVTQTAAASYDTAGIDGAENEAMLLFEVQASDLDTANGYTFASFNVADVGANAQLGAGLYLLPMKYKGATPPSVIT